MRILALDMGERRIGVALSDPLGMLASPYGVITRKSVEKDCAELRRIVEGMQVEEIIVGMPLRTDGKEGAMGKAVEEFAGALRKVVNKPVRLVDERFSTKIADTAMLLAGKDNRKRRQTIDAAAAAVILQGYLDSPDCRSRIAD